MIKIDLSSFVIKANGKIDHKSTIKKFSALLKKYDDEIIIENKVIEKAINAVFDEYPYDKINISALICKTLINLNVQIINYSYLRNKVKDYIINNSGENGKSLFGISKGKCKNVYRWSTYKKGM